MDRQLLRDLLIVNRGLYDEAVAAIRAQANYDIDRVLREVSLWAYEEANRRPKDELRRVNHEAQKQAEKRIAEIQTAAAANMGQLKTEHREREHGIRAYCEQLGNQDQESQCRRTPTDQRSTPHHGE